MNVEKPQHPLTAGGNPSVRVAHAGATLVHRDDERGARRGRPARASVTAPCASLLLAALLPLGPAVSAPGGNASATPGVAESQSAANPLPLAGSTADSRAQALAEYRLDWDRRLAPLDIEVAVSEGVATLSGTVDTSSQRDFAAGVVDDLVGIERVVNQIRVDPSAAPSTSAAETSDLADSVLAQRVVTVLAAAQDVSSGAINVEVADGVVGLSGRVPSWAQSQQAERITRSLQGVEGIINQLEVVLR